MLAGNCDVMLVAPTSDMLIITSIELGDMDSGGGIASAPLTLAPPALPSFRSLRVGRPPPGWCESR